MIDLIVALVLAGVALYIIQLIPMDGTIKQVIRVLVLVVILLWVLTWLGWWLPPRGVHVP